jgi:hypothetical protein
MRQAYLWPACSRCRHTVNPRSQTCGSYHPTMCVGGCTVPLDPAPHHAAPDSEQAVAPGPTSYLVDIASYQAGISLAVVKAAGVSAVNVKLTQGDWYTFTAGATYADQARALGMRVLGFHWLDSSATGTAQAQKAYAQMRAIGAEGVQVDCEDSSRPASWTIWRDFVTWMQDKLGRHVVGYTGDWWWQPRGWDGSALTPYLWAPPNSGYLAAYPGDTSTAWMAGYGGWDSFSLLQYAVAPITNAGGGSLSKTAIRDPAVLAALTGVPAPTTPKGDHMLLLTHINGKPAVCDGMTCRYLSDSDVGNLQWLNGHGWPVLGNGGQFWEGYVPAMGVLVDESAPPVVALTDAQAAQIAAAVVSRPDNTLGPDDEPAIVDAVKQALREGTGPAAA